MPGLIPPATLERIRSASDIVEVIQGYIPLKRAGANFTALCPFHREKTPSFNVNPAKQVFKCFGCGKGGDVFRFVQDYESLSFMEAVKRLADRAHITLEFEQNPAAQQTRHLKDTLLQIHEQITVRWQAALQNDAAGQIARDYLKKRGVTDEAVKLFRLGYAPEAWDDTVNWARSKNYELPLIEQAGLIIKKEGTDRHYDRFRGRLMFPICDEQGRVIAFSGRVLSGDEKTAKYVNSPETPIFTKGKVFYGLDKARRAIGDAGCAVICEGQLDLIACHMAGAQNVVAPQGTAFTGDHARILKRYTDEVVLCFDSDSAGQNAAVRVFDSLLASGLAIRVATIPAPHDPDTFIKANGGEAFHQLIAQAPGFFDFYLDHLCRTNDLTTDKGRLAVVHGMAEGVVKTGSSVLLDNYAQKTALRLAVSAESARTEFKKLARAHRPAPATEPSGTLEEESTAPPPRPSQTEFWLLKLVLLNDPLVPWLSEHIRIEWLSDATVRRVLALRLQAESDNAWHGIPALLDQLEDDHARNLVTEAVAENRAIPNPEQQLKDLVARLRGQHFDRQLAALNNRLNQPDMAEAERMELLRQIQELRQLKRESAG